MTWHIDPILNKAVLCNAATCTLYSKDHHFTSKIEAEAAIAMTKAITPTPAANELVFDLHRSDLTDKAYLEASFFTSLGEFVVITAEEKDDYALGTILIGSRIYGVAKTFNHEANYLDECAKLTLNIAARDFCEDLWPDKSVIALYESISKHSSAKEVSAPGGLRLSEASQSGSPQIFKGTTAVGTNISISIAYGYAVAQADLKRSSRIIYESGLSSSLFKTEDERNLFAAKAFGELVAAKV